MDLIVPPALEMIFEKEVIRPVVTCSEMWLVNNLLVLLECLLLRDADNKKDYENKLEE